LKVDQKRRTEQFYLLFLHPCNINLRDIQRKNVVNNVDISSLRAQKGLKKPTHITTQKHVEHQDATNI